MPPTVPTSQVMCYFSKTGEHPAAASSTPCCSSHGKPMCCFHYRRSHFVETGCDCCADGRHIKAVIAARDASRAAADVHPREDAVKVISAALAACGCSHPVDPYDPEDVSSVAAEAVWALIHAGLLPVVGSTAVTS